MLELAKKTPGLVVKVEVTPPPPPDIVNVTVTEEFTFPLPNPLPKDPFQILLPHPIFGTIKSPIIDPKAVHQHIKQITQQIA